MPDRLPHVRPGDPTTAIRAADYNARNAEIERRARASWGAGFAMTPGRSLSTTEPVGLWALLGGPSSPYSFAERVMNPDGTWAAGPLKGDSAYEANDVAGLDGQVVRLYPGFADDWRFQWVEAGGTTSKTCYLTIQLLDRATGDPIPGATVTGYNSSGAAIGTATTDGSGEYSFAPPSPLAGAVTASLAYGSAGVRFPVHTFSVYPCVPLQFCYCKANVTVTTAAAANDTVSPGIWFTQANPSPGVFVMTYEGMDYCSLSRFPFPFDYEALALPPPDAAGYPVGTGYLPACQTVTVHCGDDLAVDLTGQFKFSDCYVYGELSGLTVCNDLGCDTTPPAGRNLLPKTIQVRLTTLTRSCAGRPGDPLFAADDAAWITLPLTTISSGGFSRSYVYDSGCRPGAGNYLNKFGALNCPPGPYDPTFPFNSTRIAIVIALVGSTPTATLHYARFGEPDCTTVGHCDNASYPFLNADGTICGTVDTTAPLPIFCSVVDLTETATWSSGASGGSFRIEVREVACP